MLIGVALAIVLLFLLSSFKAETVGFRNRNPFNIYKSYLYKDDYVCSVGEKNFLKFVFMNDGVEAGYRLLFFYFQNGVKTTYNTSDFITRYAEGDQNYINYLKSIYGSSIPYSRLYQLGKDIVYFENGGHWYLTEDDFQRAYYSARIKQGLKDGK